MNPAGPNLLPLVVRELRIAGRQPATYRWRMGSAAAGMGFTVWSFLAWGAAQKNGHWIYGILLFSAAALAVLTGLFVASDCLSRERREGTLGFLFLTDLSATDVVLGKFAAAALQPATLLLALFPALALCQLVGGLPAPEIWRGVLALAATLLFSISAALLVSGHCQQQRRAQALSAFVLLFLNPTWVCWLSLESIYAIVPFVFWTAWLALVLLAIVCLKTAAGHLKRSWHQSLEPVRSSGDRAATIVKGDPVSWMMSRRQNSKRTAVVSQIFACLVVAANLWLIGPSHWLFSLALLFLLHLAWMLVIVARTAYAFQTDREEGSLELLLGTRLDVSEIFSGFNRHFLAQNKLILATFLVVDVLHALLLVYWGREPWAALPVAMGAVMWITMLGLGWTGVYRALLTDHPPRAMAASFNRLMLVPMIVSAIVILGASNVVEGSIFWVVAVGFTASFFGIDASSSLRKHGRELLLRPRKDPLPHIENEWSFIDWEALEDDPKNRKTALSSTPLSPNLRSAAT